MKALWLAFAVLTLVACTGGGSKIAPQSDFSAMLKQAWAYTGTSDSADLDKARQLGLELLEHHAVKDSTANRLKVLRLLTDVARMGMDYEEQMRWATLLTTLCREQGDETEALRTESEIGIVLTHLGQRSEGLAMLDKVIAQFDRQRRFNAFDACIIAMKRKLTALSLMPLVTLPGDTTSAVQRQADIIALAERFIGKLDDYESHASDYADGSERQPGADEVHSYCDFYRAQGYAFLAQSHALSGNERQARDYLTMFEGSDFGKTLNGRSAIAETQLLLGDYDKMLATYDAVDSLAGADTLNPNYVRQLRGRAVAAEAHGDHRASQQYWLRHSMLGEAVNDMLQHSEAHRYAAQYRAQEQKRQIEVQHEVLKTSRAIIIAVGIFFVAVLVIAVLLYRRNREVRRKNRSLVRQISEAMAYKDRCLKEEKLLAELTAQGEQQPQGGVGALPGDDSQETPAAKHDAQEDGKPFAPATPSAADLDAMDPPALFQYISKVIIDEQLFLHPDFDRQHAIDRFHLSKERIGTAFSQGSDSGSLAAFVNTCRLNYAVRLLLEQPDMSIVEVAENSGFSSHNHFSRNFKSAYGLSATDFRKQQK